MLYYWSSFNEDSQAALLKQSLERLKQDVVEAGDNYSKLNASLRAFDDELCLLPARETHHWVLSYECPEKRGKAQLVYQTLRDSLNLHFERPLGTHAEALKKVLCRGVDLSEARIRVGFTRGHLLEVVILVPLHVAGSDEDLQIAAEIYLEELLGDQLINTWVANVSVDRIARTRGLMVVQDSQGQAESYALFEALGLVRRGVQAVQEQLPCELLNQTADPADWTALEIPEMHEGLQSDRRFASTRFPEALKACLEGMPFDSTRFTRGGEIWIWLSWRCQDPSKRIVLRSCVENLLASSQHHSSEPVWLLGGTGFGATQDYVDLWVKPEAEVLNNLAQQVVALTGELHLGFYDTAWQGETLRFSASSI